MRALPTNFDTWTLTFRMATWRSLRAKNKDTEKILQHVSERHMPKRHVGTERKLRAVLTRKPARENPRLHVGASCSSDSNNCLYQSNRDLGPISHNVWNLLNNNQLSHFPVRRWFHGLITMEWIVIVCWNIGTSLYRCTAKPSFQEYPRPGIQVFPFGVCCCDSNLDYLWYRAVQ